MENLFNGRETNLYGVMVQLMMALESLERLVAKAEALNDLWKKSLLCSFLCKSPRCDELFRLFYYRNDYLSLCVWKCLIQILSTLRKFKKISLGSKLIHLIIKKNFLELQKLFLHESFFFKKCFISILNIITNYGVCYRKLLLKAFQFNHPSLEFFFRFKTENIYKSRRWKNIYNKSLVVFCQLMTKYYNTSIIPITGGQKNREIKN